MIPTLFITAVLLITYFIYLIEIRSSKRFIDEVPSISDCEYFSYLKREYKAVLPIVSILMMAIAFLMQDILLFLAFSILIMVPATGDFKSKYNAVYHYASAIMFFLLMAYHDLGRDFWKVLLTLFVLKIAMVVYIHTRKRSTYWTEVAGIGYVIYYLATLIF